MLSAIMRLLEVPRANSDLSRTRVMMDGSGLTVALPAGTISVPCTSAGERLPAALLAVSMIALGLTDISICQVFLEPSAWRLVMNELAQATSLKRLALTFVDGYEIEGVRCVRDAPADTRALATILSRNPRLSYLGAPDALARLDSGESGTVVAAVITHPALRSLELPELSAQQLLKILRENRTVRRFVITRCPGNRKLHDELVQAVKDNWVVEHFGVGRFANDESLHDLLCERVWWPPRQVSLDTALPLLPLRLPVYELLWILDWLWPMCLRYPWRGDPAFDPHLATKVRLLEGMTRSYQALRPLDS